MEGSVMISTNAAESMELAISELKEIYNLKPEERIKCACCNKYADEIKNIIHAAQSEEMSVEEFAKEDGTYVAGLNMLICDDCYCSCGAPTVKVSTIKNESEFKLAKVEVLKLSLKAYHKNKKRLV